MKNSNLFSGIKSHESFKKSKEEVQEKNVLNLYVERVEIKYGKGLECYKTLLNFDLSPLTYTKKTRPTSSSTYRDKSTNPSRPMSGITFHNMRKQNARKQQYFYSNFSKDKNEKKQFFYLTCNK